MKSLKLIILQFVYYWSCKVVLLIFMVVLGFTVLHCHVMKLYNCIITSQKRLVSDFFHAKIMLKG